MLPLPGPILSVLGVVVGLLESVPFLVLVVVMFPLSHTLVNAAMKAATAVIPLIITTFPFITELIRDDLHRMSPGVVRTTRDVNTGPVRVVYGIVVPRDVPSLLRGVAVTLAAVLKCSTVDNVVNNNKLNGITVSCNCCHCGCLIVCTTMVLLVVLIRVFRDINAHLTLGDSGELGGWGVRISSLRLQRGTAGAVGFNYLFAL